MRVTDHINSSFSSRWMRPVLLTLLFFVALSVGVEVFAQPEPAAVQPAPDDEQEFVPGPVNQRQAIERVRARFPGNVISINEIRQGNRIRYRVRIDNEGNIFTVFVDQATGRINRE